MTTSPYICCSDCDIYEDDFERTGIGCNWDQRSGAWSLVDFESGKRLRESGNAGALIVTQRSAKDFSFVVNAQTPLVREGAIYRVIVNYRDDNNYHFAEFEFVTGQLPIRLRKRSGGSNTTLLQKSWPYTMVGSPETVGVCFSEKIFGAGQQYAPFNLWILNPSPIADGYRAGLGNGSNVQLEYDNFSMEENFDTNEDCTACLCRCDGKPLPMELNVTVTFYGSLSACQPVSFTIKAIELYAGCPTINEDFAQGGWYGCAVVDCSDCVSPINLRVYVTLRCLNEARLFGEGDILPDLWRSASSVDCQAQRIVFNFSEWHQGGHCSNQSGDSGGAVVIISW